MDVGSQSESRGGGGGGGGRLMVCSQGQCTLKNRFIIVIIIIITISVVPVYRSGVYFVRNEMDLPLPRPIDTFLHDGGWITYSEGIVGMGEE